MKKYDVKVNGKWVDAWPFKWDEAERLWQAISEDSRLGLAVAEENLADWEYCDGENIEDFLENAVKAGFISNFDIEERVED